jgi:GTP-binding protein
LKRAFLLIDAVHGLKRSDEDLIGLLRENAISHQIILSKVDRILLPGPRKRIPTENNRQRSSDQLRELFEDMRAKIQPGNNDRPEALGEIIACSGERSFKPHGQKLGINNVRWAVLAATGLGDKVRRVSPSKFLTPATEQEIHYSTMSDDRRLEHPSLD